MQAWESRPSMSHQPLWVQHPPSRARPPRIGRPGPLTQPRCHCPHPLRPGPLGRASCGWRGLLPACLGAQHCREERRWRQRNPHSCSPTLSPPSHCLHPLQLRMPGRGAGVAPGSLVPLTAGPGPVQPASAVLPGLSQERLSTLQGWMLHWTLLTPLSFKYWIIGHQWTGCSPGDGTRSLHTELHSSAVCVRFILRQKSP